MRQFASILVITHGDWPSPPELKHLGDLAQRDGATIKLMAVFEPFPWYTRYLLVHSDELERLRADHALRRLDALATALCSHDLKITTKVAIGHSPLEFIREVLVAGHDLVVKVAGAGERGSFGSTDLRLLRTCPCPVLILHPKMQHQEFRRILVAVDPPPVADVIDVLHLRKEFGPGEQALNVKLLELATRLAELQGGDLHVVHAWSAPGEEMLRNEGRLPVEEIDEYVSELCDADRKAVEQLLGHFSSGSVTRQVHLIKGQPADVISEYAKTHDIDLIVMGTVVRTGIPGFLIGNTAETVLQRVDCSVLAVKPDGFVTPVALSD
jgi:nucleotide-binding universal stress UspA family protein